MSNLRPFLAGSLCSLVVLLLTVPSVAADLTVSTRSGTTFGIATNGSSTLVAPQNTTIDALWGGYLIDWKAPSEQVTGYTVYRVPTPGTSGGTQVFYVSASRTALYDRPASGDYVYFVTAVTDNGRESIPGRPASTLDVASNYPHCSVVSIYYSAPFYGTNIECLFPIA